MDSQHRLGLFYVFLATLGYSTLPIIARFLYQVSDITPTDVVLWRFIFATPMIWLVIAIQERKNPLARLEDSPQQTLKILSLGIIYAISAGAAFFALSYIPASTFTVFFYTYPAMVAIISVFLGIRLSVWAWIALGLTLAGSMLTVTDLNLSAGNNTLLGISLALLNALSVAIYFFLSNKILKSSKSMSHSTAWVITGTLLALLVLIPIFGLHLPANLPTLGLLVLLAFFSSVMPIFALNLGLQKLGVAWTSIVSSAEPVITMLLALFILQETILPQQWLGAIAIVTGVILLVASPRPKAKFNAVPQQA